MFNGAQGCGKDYGENNDGGEKDGGGMDGGRGEWW